MPPAPLANRPSHPAVALLGTPSLHLTSVRWQGQSSFVVPGDTPVCQCAATRMSLEAPGAEEEGEGEGEAAEGEEGAPAEGEAAAAPDSSASD